jgi:adenosine deaminase
MTLRSRVRAMPKIELHVHLEGAIPLTALWELLRKYGPPAGVLAPKDLESRFAYKDFQHFLDTWMWKNGYLREYDDFAFVASQVAADLASQGIVYVEAFFSPGDFVQHGLRPQRLAEAIRKGLDEHADAITVNLVADLVRNFGPGPGLAWLRELAEVRQFGIVGVGIGGSEHAFPPEPYAAVFEEARALGFRTSAHAGEAAGPDSVWGAVRVLRVDRVGHGTRAVEDPSLVAWLAEHRVPIEMCPISNLRTGVVRDLAAHPIRAFFDAGLPVSVNSDDPKMFNTSLEDEYEALATHLDFTWADVQTLNRNALAAAWCSDDEKRRLAALIGADELGRRTPTAPR